MKCVSNYLFWAGSGVGKQNNCKQVEQKTNKNSVSHLANRTFL